MSDRVTTYLRPASHKLSVERRAQAVSCSPQHGFVPTKSGTILGNP